MSNTSRTSGKSSSESTSPTMPGNYPSADDTTSEGGYGGDAFAPVSQRGLIDQTATGQPLGNELHDAFQGEDQLSRERYAADQKHQGQGLNPYGGETFENRDDASEQISSSIKDTRARE